MYLTGQLALQSLGWPPVKPLVSPILLLTSGPAYGLADALLRAVGSYSLFQFLLLFVCYLLTRREWLAVFLYIVFFMTTGLMNLPEDERGFWLALIFIAAVVELAVMMPLGVLSLSAMCLTCEICRIPFTFDTNTWYSGSSLVYLSALLGLVVYGFIVAGGGKCFAWLGNATDDVERSVSPEIS
jgi:hypothetical protein